MVTKKKVKREKLIKVLAKTHQVIKIKAAQRGQSMGKFIEELATAA